MVPVESSNRRKKEEQESKKTIRDWFLFREKQTPGIFTHAALDPLSFAATNVLDCMIYGRVIFEEGAVMSPISYHDKRKQEGNEERERDGYRRIGKQYTKRTQMWLQILLESRLKNVILTRGETVIHREQYRLLYFSWRTKKMLSKGNDFGHSTWKTDYVYHLLRIKLF